MQYDLRMLLEIFPDAVSYYNDWSNKVDLGKIEICVQDVRENKKPFSKEHYEIIEDKEHKFWPFSKWWRFPSLTEQDFRDINSALSIRADNVENCIKLLLNRIKFITIVSAILRFVDPYNFGILSPPVEKVLEVKRGADDIERYMNYLKNLNDIKDYYKFPKIADVDMALYVYALLGEAKVKKWADQRYIEIRKHHEEGERPSFIKKIRARNLFSGIWNPQKLEMAQLLLETDDFIAAGILAGVALEIYLRKLAKHCNINLTYLNKNNKNEDKGGGRLIDELAKYRKIDSREVAELFNAWQTRCRCVHGDKETYDNVRFLIKISNNFFDRIRAMGVTI
jgi:hypothetical protein